MHRLGVKHSYTLEASFGGSTLGDRKGTHLGCCDLENMGRQICDTFLGTVFKVFLKFKSSTYDVILYQSFVYSWKLYFSHFKDYFDPDPSKIIYCQNEILKQLREAMKAKYGEDALPTDPSLLHGMESDTSGSNSSSDDGLPAHLEDNIQVFKNTIFLILIEL